MNSRQIIIILAVILGLLLILAGWWGMKVQQLNKANEQLSGEKTELREQLDGLEAVKRNLEIEVDSLEKAYLAKVVENEELQGSLASAKNEVIAKNVALKNAKKANTSELNDLKAEIQELLASKGELEKLIKDVQSENDSLKSLAGQLEKDLADSRQENEELASLNRAIQEEVGRLTLANFKASAFQIEVEQKNSKVTSKSKRARRIKVNFDLTNVPEEFQGVRPIYLAITDSKGTPINASNPVSVTINVNGQSMDLIAVEEKEVNIEGNQRLSFSHDLEEKLATGFYRAAVFTDIGFLGASSFKLR